MKKNIRLSAFLAFLSFAFVTTFVNFSYCDVVGDVLKTEVEISGMHHFWMDIDTAIYQPFNDEQTYIIYTYVKQVNNKFQIFCYTVDQNGNKSDEVRISNLANLSVYDNEVMTYLRRTYPNRNMPAELTPTDSGDNICPRIACDSNGTVLVVWQYRHITRGGFFSYDLVLGVYLEIDPDNGSINFRDGTEPFIISTVHDINPGRNAPGLDIYNYNPEVDCVEDDYFCVVYNEYIPNLQRGAERLIVKLIGCNNQLTLYRSGIPNDRTYATPYYNFPVDNRGFRKGVINKAIICNKELVQGDFYRMYLVYDGLGTAPANLRNPYTPGDIYKVGLASFRGRNIFVHMERGGCGGPGLCEESYSPSTLANPELAARKQSSSVYIGNPLLCIGRDGLVIAYTLKVGDIDDPQRTRYVNGVIRYQGALPRLRYEEVYGRGYTEPNILTDIVSDPTQETLLLIKQVPVTISLSQLTRLGVNTNYLFDLVDLKGIVIPDSDNIPDSAKEFYFSTGSPGYIYGGKFIEKQNIGYTEKYIYWAKIAPADYRNQRGIQQLGTWTAKVCTNRINYPLMCPEYYLEDNANLTLQVNANNNFSAETLNWNLNGVDQQYINQEWISPSYTIYYFRDDGRIRQINNARPPARIADGRYDYAAYVVVNFGDGISLKSRIRKFTLLR